jgi:hypothetical protein
VKTFSTGLLLNRQGGTISATERRIPPAAANSARNSMKINTQYLGSPLAMKLFTEVADHRGYTRVGGSLSVPNWRAAGENLDPSNNAA